MFGLGSGATLAFIVERRRRQDAAAAEELGRRLAVTHAAGAGAWGAGPDGWDGDGFVGPLPLPLRAQARRRVDG